MRIGKLKAHAVGLFLSDKDIIKVTAIVSPTEVFRLTRRRFGKNKRVNRYSTDAVLHLGKPNYAERAIINKMAAKNFPKMIVKVAA